MPMPTTNTNIQGSESFIMTKNMMISTNFPVMKHSGMQLPDQDSSLTQSTGESGGGEVASFGEHNFVNTNLSGLNK